MLNLLSKWAILVCALFPTVLLGQAFDNFIVSKKLLTIGSGVSAEDVYCAAQDRNGFMWFGTKGGLSRFDGSNFKAFNKNNGLASDLVSNIVVDDNNLIFIEHGNQWQPFDIQNKIDVLDANKFQVVSKDYSNGDYPFEIKMDLKQGRNWRIKYLPINECWNKSLQKEKDALLYITQKGTGQLLITKDDGVYYIEKNIKVRIFEGHEFYDNGNTGVNHFYKDSNGILWICVKKGIYQVKIIPDRFKKYFTRKDLNVHVIPQTRGIWVEDDGTKQKVSAVVLNGLISNEGNGTFERKMGLGWAILGVGDSLLYSVRNEVYFSERNSSSARHICTLKNSRDELINCMFSLNDSIVLVGSSSSIFLVNRITGESQLVRCDQKRFPGVFEVYRIFKSSKGIAAIAESGIYLIENGNVIDYFGAAAKVKDHKIPIQSILDAHESSKGELWIASNGMGLCRWEWNSKKSPTLFDKSNGLPSDIIYRIEEDNWGNLWMSTDDGLCRYSSKGNIFKVYTVVDGLPSQEFNRTSSFRAKDGTLFFGGVNGVVSFQPTDFKDEVITPRLMITAFARFASKESGFIDETMLFYGTNQVQIFPKDYLVKLDFALLDYGTSQPLYWYRIKGVVDNWYQLESNSLTLGSLDYGEYTLEVKALAQSESGVPQIIKIPIQVLLPFYLKLWFLLSLAVILLVLVILLVRRRGKILKKRNVFLERAILERTSDLELALNEKENLLKELHHRVKNNLQLVISLLDLQKEEVDDEKSKEVLINSQMRLMSISLIHQHFYKSDDLAFINFDEFLEDLLREMKLNFGQNIHSILFEFNSLEKQLDIDVAIPLGMIVNELVTNSFKHISESFFPIQIVIVLNDIASEDGLELIYRDNGPGILDKLVYDNPQTLGLKLIKGLTAQIRGKVDYSNDHGSQYIIRFKRKLNKKN